MKKINSVMTERGILRVGDTVKLTWSPASTDEDFTAGNTQKVWAIWKGRERGIDGDISLAFDRRGVTNEGFTWNWSGDILTKRSIIKIIRVKITNWREVIEG